jgi:SAM-dependent methyltransferase
MAAAQNNKVIELLLELGISNESSVEPYFDRVRDRDDVGVLRCARSGVIVLTRTDHMSIEHYVDRESHSVSIAATETTPGIRVEMGPLVPNDDDVRRARSFKDDVAGRDWLDVGSGAGGVIALLAPHAKSVLAIEPSRACRVAIEANGFRAKARVGEVADSSADVITVFHALEHFADPIMELVELNRALRPGGSLIVEVPHARDFLLEELDCREFRSFTLWSEHLILHTRDSLRRFLNAAGFEDVEVRGIQRYSLSNHLHWLAKHGPGGHKHWSWFDTPELTSAYEANLARLDRTDTLIAVARK